MKENIRNKTMASLDLLESQVKNKVKMSRREFSENVKAIKSYMDMTLAEYTADEKKEIKDRIAKIEEMRKDQYKLVRRRIAGIAAFTTAGAVAIGSLAYAVNSKKASGAEETEVTVEADTIDSMSEEMQAFSDTTVSSANNALEVGINLTLNDELTEADKETYARMLTNYRIVANNDNFTKLEYAEMFGENTNPTEDLVESFFEYNTEIKKHLITVSANNMLDYNYLYENEKDTEVLNESERLIANINDAADKDAKLQASKDWYSYVVSVLTSTEGNIALSSQALDTLITHSEAYDELTRGNYANVQGAHIDDELEHYLNTAKDACLGVSNNENIEVEELTIENLKSVFRLSFINKLNEKYDAALSERELQLQLGNELNKYNSYNNIIEYVKENIDLTKYVAIDRNAYIEKQKEEKGLNAPAKKSKDDSGVSNGKGGVISKSQLAQYGIDPSDPNAKAKLEAAVQAEEAKKSEESAVVVEPSGNRVDMNATDYAAEFSEGQSDGISGAPQKAGKSSAYYNGYALGQQMRAEAQQQFTGETETYVPVDGAETNSQSISEQGYTEMPSTPGTTFVPVDGAEDVSEVIETYDYTSSIKELRNLRDTLVAGINEQYGSGSKTV